MAAAHCTKNNTHAKKMKQLLLFLLLTSTAYPQFGIGTKWTYTGKNPYSERVIGITYAPMMGQSDLVRIAYTDHGRAFSLIRGTHCIGHKTAEGFSLTASVGDKLPALYKSRGNALFGNRWGLAFSDGRTSGMGWQPTMGVICTWAINGNHIDTTSQLASFSIKADGVAATQPVLANIFTADKVADQIRNDRRISFGPIRIAWGDADSDGDIDAAALVVWEYGGSGYEQRLYVMLNKAGQYSQTFAQRIALKGEDSTFGKWLTIDGDGVQVYRYDNQISRWSVSNGKVKRKG